MFFSLHFKVQSCALTVCVRDSMDVCVCVREKKLTVLRRRAGRHGPVAELLPAQADLLLELLDLAVAVALLLAAPLLLPPTQVALHQLDGGDQGLGDAEVGVLLEGRTG